MHRHKALGGVLRSMQGVLESAAMLCRWNPAVEQQAQDRIHRLGQFKPIAVHRFIIAGTIEERILKLQVSFGQIPPFTSHLPNLGRNEDFRLGG